MQYGQIGRVKSVLSEKRASDERRLPGGQIGRCVMEPFSGSNEWSRDESPPLPDLDCKYELVEGETVPAPAGFRHGVVGSRILIALGVFVRE